MENKFGILSSSANPKQLGLMVQGIIIGLGTIIIHFASLKGIEITSQEITEQAVDIGSAVSSLFVVIGLVRKVVLWVSEKLHSKLTDRG